MQCVNYTSELMGAARVFRRRSPVFRGQHFREHVTKGKGQHRKKKKNVLQLYQQQDTDANKIFP